MKELVEIIAKALVDNPDEVVVTETEKDKAIIVDLKVAPSDMGKVIGKSGRIAKSIRSVVSAAASKTDKKVIVEIDNLSHKDYVKSHADSFVSIHKPLHGFFKYMECLWKIYYGLV